METPVSSRDEHSWSLQYANRRAVAGKFGDIFRLPLVKRCWQVLHRHLSDGQRVLEVGAGNRNMQSRILGRCPNATYESMDIDPEGDHDYQSLGAIDCKFDTVFAFEVVEHIDMQTLPGWLDELARVTRFGGRLLLSTPNIYYPPAYLRDITHRTPLCFDELGGLLRSHGFEVEAVYRCHNLAGLKVFVRRYLFGWMFRLMRIDFAPQIVIVGRRMAVAEAARKAA